MLGTNSVTVSENVAYDVIGFCYYLEDGVEENNKLLFNLAAHIHSLGPDPPNGGGGQTTNVYVQGPGLTLPADVTASGFYITNVHNDLIGNAASGVSMDYQEEDHDQTFPNPQTFCIAVFTLINLRDGQDLRSQSFQLRFKLSRIRRTNLL